MAFAGINIELIGLDKIQLRLGATDKQVRNAIRNAQDQQARNSKETIDQKISGGIGLPRTQVRRRTYVKKVDPRKRPYAAVAFSGKGIPIKDWNFRIVPVPSDRTGTKAYVLVRNTYTGAWDRPYAFINPKGKKQATLVRYSNRKGDVQIQGAMTLRRPFQETLSGPFLQATESKFEKLVIEKIEKQIRGRR